MATTPINSVYSVTGVSRLQVVRAPDEPASVGETRSDDDAVSVDTFPSSPPPEVLDAIAAAGDAFEQLAAKGLHVSFDTSADGGLTAALQNADGSTRSELTPSDVLSLADGTAPNQTGTSHDVNDQHDLD